MFGQCIILYGNYSEFNVKICQFYVDIHFDWKISAGIEYLFSAVVRKRKSVLESSFNAINRARDHGVSALIMRRSKLVSAEAIELKAWLINILTLNLYRTLLRLFYSTSNKKWFNEEFNKLTKFDIPE